MLSFRMLSKFCAGFLLGSEFSLIVIMDTSICLIKDIISYNTVEDNALYQDPAHLLGNLLFCT